MKAIVYFLRNPLEVLHYPSALGTLLVNLIPVMGVAFFGWSLESLVVLYWIENVIIGAFNLARIVASGVAKGPIGMLTAAFMGPFFTIHYGMFCFVHGMFVLAIFAAPGEAGNFTPDAGLSGLPALVTQALAAQPGLIWAVAAIALWEAAQFVVNFLIRGEFKIAELAPQMMAPYGRIVFLHIGIFAGAFSMMALGRPIWGILLLALAKTLFDTVSTGARARAQAEKKGVTPSIAPAGAPPPG